MRVFWQGKFNMKIGVNRTRLAYEPNVLRIKNWKILQQQIDAKLPRIAQALFFDWISNACQEFKVWNLIDNS